MPFNHSTLDYMIPTGINKDTSPNNRSQSREFSKTFKSTHFNDEAAGPVSGDQSFSRSPTRGKKMFDHGKNSLAETLVHN